MYPIGKLKCYCGTEIYVCCRVVQCPKCGNKYIYKLRSDKFVLMEFGNR